MSDKVPENKHTVKILEGNSGRLDKFLSEKIAGMTRTKIKNLLEKGQITCNGNVAQAAHKIKPGETYIINIPPLEPSTIMAKNIPLDIIFEDEHMLVVNKQAGLTVHPGAGNYNDTLVNALLAHCKGSLSGIGGVERPGIVHRLDRETSGLMVVAKTDAAHLSLSDQIRDRALKRIYIALVFGVPNPLTGKITANIARSKANRKRMAIFEDGEGKTALTNYKVLETLAQGSLSLVECRLETGRTHQIRVHMTHLGNPLVGDKVYGNTKTRKLGKISEEIKKILSNFSRQALHSKKIAFMHPANNKLMEFEVGLPPDIQGLVTLLKKC